MTDSTVFTDYLTKLAKEKSPEELADFLANLMKYSASELYLTIVDKLTEEDMQAIESIPNDKDAEKEMSKRFQMRTGMTPDEYIVKLRDTISKGFLEQKEDNK